MNINGKKIYHIKSISDGKVYSVYPEDISGSYTFNGKEMVSFSHGHVVDEGEIISSGYSDILNFLPPAVSENKTTGVNNGILYAAALGLGALLLLV